MKKTILAFLFATTLASSAYGGTCTDFKGCVALVHELTGQNYIWDPRSTIVNFSATPNLEITKENAEIIFTAILDQTGYARAPVGDGKTFRIVTGANRKEMEIPIIEASAEKAPTFGPTWDWITMRYKTKTPDLAPYLESAFRLHMPRESRLQADLNSGILIVTGAAPVVRQMYETLKASDKPLSGAAKESHARWERQISGKSKGSKEEDK